MTQDKQYAREYYLRNRERILARQKVSGAAWKAANKDKINAASRARHAIDPELRAYRTSTSRKSALKKFGLTVQDYDAMFINQGGVCAICGRQQDEPGRMFAAIVYVDKGAAASVSFLRRAA